MSRLFREVPRVVSGPGTVPPLSFSDPQLAVLEPWAVADRYAVTALNAPFGKVRARISPTATGVKYGANRRGTAANKPPTAPCRHPRAKTHVTTHRKGSVPRQEPTHHGTRQEPTHHGTAD